MQHLPIYLDYMSTTPVDPEVIETMLQFMGPDALFGNPASTTHAYGKLAMRAVETARQQVADVIGGDSQDIIWTSGATESDNLALLGAASFYQRKGRHIITMTTEHKAVLDTCQALEKQGFELTYLPPKHDGLLDLNLLEKALRPDTILVSIMHVNNEIGVIQDLQEIGALLDGQGILFHVDAAQSAGKIAIDVDKMKIDLMSFSGHKIYAPKGVGALYVRSKPRVRLQAMIFGGGHERGMRSGTLATQQIAGMGKAFEIAHRQMDSEHQRLIGLKQKLWDGIKHIQGVSLNGSASQRVAGNLNVCFAGVEGDSLLLALRDIAVSTTSACSSASVQPSYVLTSLGLSDELAHSSLRISLGRFSTEQDIDKTVSLIQEQVPRLQAISPLNA